MHPKNLQGEWEVVKARNEAGAGGGVGGARSGLNQHRKAWMSMSPLVSYCSGMQHPLENTLIVRYDKCCKIEVTELRVGGAWWICHGKPPLN